jgi:hypothetical protein
MGGHRRGKPGNERAGPCDRTDADHSGSGLTIPSPPRDERARGSRRPGSPDRGRFPRFRRRRRMRRRTVSALRPGVPLLSIAA